MKSVIDLHEGREFLGLGAPVRRLVHPLTTGSVALGVSICLIPPASSIKKHRHPYEEAYFVVEGRGVMQLEGVGEIELFPGRSVYIAPNLVHGQVNTSKIDELKISLLSRTSPCRGPTTRPSRLRYALH